MAPRKTKARGRVGARRRASSKSAAKATAPTADAASVYAPTVQDLFALARKLGASSAAEVASLLGACSDDELIARGSTVPTARVAAEAFRILAVAESFFVRAPEGLREAVNLGPGVLRIAAWAAAETVRMDERLTSLKGRTRPRLAAERAEADAVIKQARAERDKLATQVKGVGRSVATDAAVAIALAPAALGEPDPGVHASITRLVAEGLRLLTLDDAGTRTRAGHLRLTAEGLDRLAVVADNARVAAELRDGPSAVVTQRTVDRWVGITLGLLEIVVGAFRGARGTHREVPGVEFVARRPRRSPAGPPSSPSVPPSSSSLPN